MKAKLDGDYLIERGQVLLGMKRFSCVGANVKTTRIVFITTEKIIFPYEKVCVSTEAGNGGYMGYDPSMDVLVIRRLK